MACYSPTKIKDDLICPICFEDYDLKRIPKMLDCNHTFCGQCLEASKTTLCGGLPQVQLQDQVLVPGSLKCAICRSVYLSVNIDDLLENYVITGHLKKIEEEKDREIALQLQKELNESEEQTNSELTENRKKDKEIKRNEENKKKSKIKTVSRISKIKDVRIIFNRYNLRSKKFITGDKEAGECGERSRESDTEAVEKPKKTSVKKAVKTPDKKVASKTTAKKVASKTPVKKIKAKKTPAKRNVEVYPDSADDGKHLTKKKKGTPTKTSAKKNVNTPAKKGLSKTPAKKSHARKIPAKKAPSKKSAEEIVHSDSTDDDEPLHKKTKATPPGRSSTFQLGAIPLRSQRKLYQRKLYHRNLKGLLKHVRFFTFHISNRSYTTTELKKILSKKTLS